MTGPILLIDNYDSFTYNLAHLFGELGWDVAVRRNDAITVEEARTIDPSHLVISPGPGRPESSGVSLAMIEAFAGRVPILGVCLGHQAIVVAFGGTVGAAHTLVHGKATTVTATAADEEVMAVRHRTLAIEGVQFHPESVLTPCGSRLARNFLGERQ